MEWWHVYLFTRLDGLRNAADPIAFISLFFLIMSGLAIAIFHEDIDTELPCLKKAVIGLAVVCSFSSFIMLAVPTQKEAAAIYLLPKLANSDFAKEAGQIPTDAAKLMRMKLEAWIAEMDPKKEK
jgi:hypothetical protein